MSRSERGTGWVVLAFPSGLIEAPKPLVRDPSFALVFPWASFSQGCEHGAAPMLWMDGAVARALG